MLNILTLTLLKEVILYYYYIDIPILVLNRGVTCGEIFAPQNFIRLPHFVT